MTRSTIDTGMCNSHPTDPPRADGLEICTSCNRWIDPNVCGCGDSITHSAWDWGHAPVPMGCDCHRAGAPHA